MARYSSLFPLSLSLPRFSLEREGVEIPARPLKVGDNEEGAFVALPLFRRGARSFRKGDLPETDKKGIR